MGQAISSVQFYLFVGSLTALASVLGLAFFLAGVTQHKAYREHHRLPSSLPWIGRHSNQLFASVRANIRGVTQSASLFSEAYNRYSLKGVISVVPTWTKGPQVLVPPSMIPWLGKQPSAELNAKDCTFENMQFKYTVQHPEITHNDLLDLMIKRDLTKSVGHLNDVVVEEIQESMKDLFQSNVDGDGWTRISVWDAMIKTVARSANRVFVGPELCKNEEYLMSCVRWTRDIQVSGAILHMFPKFLKPVVAWFATIPNRRDTKINLDHAVPLVRQRLNDMTAALQNPENGYEAPDELLSWMIKESFKRTQESEKTPEALAYRLLLLNFAAVSTSTIGATNAVLDLLADPNFSIVIPALREEAQTVLDAHNGVWTKTAVQSLRKLDSALRESARVSGVGGTGLARRVRLSQGVTLPDGTWVPQGATVGVAQAGVHFDPAIYGPTAEDFDAFRFSRPREEAEKSGGPMPENEDLVTTSPAFLAFSHGIHACPGRFFAANQLKLILANFLLEYEVQPLPFRPANTPLGDVMIPPLKAAMTVRKRIVKA